MRQIALFILAAALAAPAFAAPDAAPTTAKPEKPKKEKRICKRIDTSESRMGKSVCKTAEEWEQTPDDGSAKIGYDHQ